MQVRVRSGAAVGIIDAVRSSAVALDRLLDGVPPASGAVVMGTGIVSVALSLDGWELLSRILLVAAATVWVTLAVLVAVRATRDRARFRRDVGTPAVLTAVAGSAVLGSRLVPLGWTLGGGVLLAVALVLWLALLGPVLRHWRTPTLGGSFMLTVSTESLALLGASLALEWRAGWLLVASLVPFVLGLGSYLFVASRFDVRQLAVGRGDHWVTGGALAISTLAAGRIALAARELDALRSAAGVLEAVAVGLWAVTLLWLPMLLVAEARWRRTTYDVRRWSTVFPVGMYAACSFVVGGVASSPAITGFARVSVWAAVAVWAVVACGLARSAARALSAGG